MAQGTDASGVPSMLLTVNSSAQIDFENRSKYFGTSEINQDPLQGVCLSMQGLASEASEMFGKVQGLMRGTMPGKVLAEEQYVSRKVKDHLLDSEGGVQSFQGCISGIEFLYLWNSFPQMPHKELERVVQIISEAEVRYQVSSSADETKTDETPKEPQQSWLLADDDDEPAEPEDNFAVGNLIKGTALRELGQYDAATECLERIREETCYVETELFVYPMAAYERALLLICRHISQQDCQRPTNFDLLLEAKQELAIAEGFKQDYNFLWRLLGRVHAARAAIQGLMGEDKSANGSKSLTDEDSITDQWNDDEIGDSKVDDAVLDDLNLQHENELLSRS